MTAQPGDVIRALIAAIAGVVGTGAALTDGSVLVIGGCGLGLAGTAVWHFLAKRSVAT